VLRDFSFNHVQNLKPKLTIDAETVAARAAACFTNSNKRKAEDELLHNEQTANSEGVYGLARAERNAAFAARFSLVDHSDTTDKEAARHAIDAFSRERIPEAAKVEVELSGVDPVTRAERNVMYAARFQRERDALRNVPVPIDQQEAARRAVATHHEKMKLLRSVPHADFEEVYRKRNAIMNQNDKQIHEVAAPVKEPSPERSVQMQMDKELWERIVRNPRCSLIVSV
jgi:hypothetical protein